MYVRSFLLLCLLALVTIEKSFCQKVIRDSVWLKQRDSIFQQTYFLERSIFGFDVAEVSYPAKPLRLDINMFQFDNFIRKRNKGVTYYRFDCFNTIYKYTFSIELFVYKNELFKVIECNNYREFILHDNKLYSIIWTSHGLSFPDEEDCFIEEDLPIYFSLLETLKVTKFQD